MKRRILSVIGVVLVLIVVISISVIYRYTNSTLSLLLNDSLEEREEIKSFEYGEFDYSLSHFPDITVELTDIKASIIKNNRDIDLTLDRTRVTFSPMMLIPNKRGDYNLTIETDSLSCKSQDFALSSRDTIQIEISLDGDRVRHIELEEDNLDCSLYGISMDLDLNLTSIDQAIFKLYNFPDSLAGGSISGDIDGNRVACRGDLLSANISLLSNAIRSGTSDIMFDLRGYDISDSTFISSIEGEVSLSTSSVVLAVDSITDELNGYIKDSYLSALDIEPFSTKATISDGTITLSDSLDIIFSKQRATVKGIYNLDTGVAATVDLTVGRECLGPKVESYVKIIPGANRLKQFEIELKLSGKGDTFGVGTDLSKVAVAATTELLKDDGAKSEIKKLGMKLFDLFR